MKTHLFLFAVLICTNSVFGQLKVQDDGNVALVSQGDTEVSNARMQIKTSLPYGLYITRNSSSPGSAIGVSSIGTGRMIGLEAYANATSGSSGALGVFGSVGSPLSTPTGGNFHGVFGYLNSPNLMGSALTGIVWATGTYFPMSQPLAGFFLGDVKIQGGELTIGTTVYTSDKRYKKNIAVLDGQSTLNSVLSLNPVKYNLKQQYFTAGNSAEDAQQHELYSENSQMYKKQHYGLIAQELQQLYPDLVYSDSLGYLGIDYIGIIPLLIQSIKELNAKIEHLENTNAQAAPMQVSANMAAAQEIINRNAELFQNTPNPFNENSEIAFYLPQSVKSAMLCVYDMNGKQLSQNIITERGDAKFVINGKSYAAGMYLYSLIVDNQVIDTKRMILTK
ncbi:MAG: tail fiber domain-containing protein [Prevotellaceae bacterium]|jgi:hypothetical protein|nr:tail fiber domain-containing protein [Prevotellaceae bacterium]